MRLSSLRAIVISGAGAAALMTALPAVAQESGTDSSEEVVVTGTRAKGRTSVTTAVPVDVFSAEQIAKAGALGGEFGQTLQNLVPSFNFPRQSNSGSADYVRPAQLRGLAPDQVLVLVNGKRRHSTSVISSRSDSEIGGGTAPVDFNSIPTNAIARVEVLRDGAGALYGSDAIAGVINVILKSEPQGWTANASYGAHTTDFEPTDDRLTDGATYVAEVDGGFALGESGFLRIGAEYKKREKTFRGGFDDTQTQEDFGFFPPGNVPLVGGRRNFAPGDGQTENINLWFNAATDFSEGVSFYAFGTYNDRDAEGTGFFRYPISSANILSVYPLGFRPVTTAENRDITLTGGLRGEAAGWGWDLSLNYGENQIETGARNSLNPSLGPTSPRRFRSGTFSNELFSVNADVTREFDFGLAAPAGFAAGLEYRNEVYESEAGEPASYAAGPLAGPPDFLNIGAQAGGGLTPADERNPDRDVLSAYAELSLSLADNFLVDFAGRFEDYSDFGSEVSGKVAARWEFVDGIALRASLSNSFRAPALAQIGFAGTASTFGSTGQLITTNQLTNDDPLAVALGAEGLDAEKATNYSAGLTLNFDEFRLSVDAFQVDVADRIVQSSQISISDMPAGAAAIAAARNIGGATFLTNAIDTRTQGIDAVATWSTEVSSGTLSLSAAYAYAETDITAIRDTGVVSVTSPSLINYITASAPKSKVILTADWTNEDVSALVRVTRYGSATRVFDFDTSSAQTYDGEWQLDAEFGVTIVKGVQLYVGASNLLDEYPDLTNASYNYFNNLPYDVLSPIGFNGRYLYTGIRTSF